MQLWKRYLLHPFVWSLPNLKALTAFLLLLLMVSSAPAQRLPLPPQEQEAVNSSIDSGVSYLKRTQQKNGTWVNPRGHWGEATFHGHVYAIGYTALPGLTLLECGVPANDPIVQQAAHFVRSKAATIDRTYELSLAILFLDRLGDPKDQKLIQTFALRLIAGQSTTGGWGYKCPLLGNKTQMELLTALRHLDAEEMPAIAKKPGNLPLVARAPGAPPLNGELARPGAQPMDKTVTRPGALQDSPGRPGSSSLGGTVAQPGSPSFSGGISRGSAGEASSLSGTASEEGMNRSSTEKGSMDISGEQGRDCLGLAILEEKSPESLEMDPNEKASPNKPEGKGDNNKAADAKADPRKSTKHYVIPERIKVLPVIQDPAVHALQDPLNRGEETFLTTTDNSNTQFAILALWRAQQYDVPTKRSLNLIVRRYVSSQNADGSWGYHYQFGGGGNPIRLPNAMICVGLIGLAVGHGMAQPKPVGQPVQDARIVNGLIALNAYVGQPVENRGKLSMQNLYFLWSLERVAVLYNLPTIGDKDWYRWGAQVLVRNQASDGNWAGGLYIGSTPPLDTCLALLFLKRANLVKDLTAKLPFSAEELNNSIMEKLAPTPKPTESPKPTKEKKASVEPPKPTEPESVTTKAPPPQQTTVGEDSSTENTGSSKKKWVWISIALFVLFSGGSLAFILLAINRRNEAEEEKPAKPKKRSDSRDAKAKTKAARPSSTRS